MEKNKSRLLWLAAFIWLLGLTSIIRFFLPKHQQTADKGNNNE
jgi:hypothetical protein